MALKGRLHPGANGDIVLFDAAGCDILRMLMQIDEPWRDYQPAASSVSRPRKDSVRTARLFPFLMPTLRTASSPDAGFIIRPQLRSC